MPRSTTRDPSPSTFPPFPSDSSSLSPSPNDPSPPPSLTLPFHTLCPERIRQREAKAQTRAFFSRVILAIFARGRAVLFERAVSSTRQKKIDELRPIERERERETHTHAQGRNEAIFRPVRFARSNRVPALSATENSVQTQFRSFLYSDSGNAPLESASEAGPIYRLTVTRTKG